MDGVDEEQIKRMCANTAISSVVTIIACLLRIRARRKSICNDQARGEFVRSVHDKIGTNNAIPLDDDDRDIPLESETELQSDANTTTNSTSGKSQYESNTESSSSKRPRKSNDDELIRSFVESMSESIRNQHIIHWTEQLAAALKTHSDSYSDEFLDKVLDHLYESEREARRFFIKTKEAQKRFIVSLAAAQGWDTS